jgi:hypothetical protein
MVQCFSYSINKTINKDFTYDFYIIQIGVLCTVCYMCKIKQDLLKFQYMDKNFNEMPDLDRKPTDTF